MMARVTEAIVDMPPIIEAAICQHIQAMSLIFLSLWSSKTALVTKSATTIIDIPENDTHERLHFEENMAGGPTVSMPSDNMGRAARSRVLMVMGK